MGSGNPALMKTAERRRRVMRLREGGATWREIARSLEQNYGSARLPNGWDERYAYKDFKRELEKIQDETAEATEEVRQMELRRVDRLLRSIWSKALGSGGSDGSVTWKQQKEAIDRVIKLQKRRADLKGLDAPEQVEHSGSLDVSHEVDLSSLTDEQIERLAEGAPPEEVL